ncbi:hypothetical protein BDV96DRAFT_584929 [Lophiotrema nucula]|uniref:Uncharacterized protein n=1 Tax=Lophiotrema nucula TaxID=690887 RepID=A0A6A5YS16_9PLEO|nr:hypothetical protein BDV96DRAFT_584929 [Lophiotrema nucula]
MQGEEVSRLMIATAIDGKPATRGRRKENALAQLIILQPEVAGTNCESVIAATSSLLEMSGVDNRIARISDLAGSDLTNKTIISFSELHRPLLSTLGATELETLKRITQDSAGLLWITRGANRTHSELAMFQDLARTLR